MFLVKQRGITKQHAHRAIRHAFIDLIYTRFDRFGINQSLLTCEFVVQVGPSFKNIACKKHENCDGTKSQD